MTMKITDVRLRQLSGAMESPDGELWEERVMTPLDVYPEHQTKWRSELRLAKDGQVEMESIFVEIETADGVTGLGGPVSMDVAWIIHRQLRGLLIGEDPLAIERAWDLMYRSAVHGRKGDTMIAISAVDCALWDLKGKALSVPVYVLLGGPVRTSIPVYASALGFSLQPEKVHQVSRKLSDAGFVGIKWFPRKGPVDGREGMRLNVELAQTVREAVGADVDVMLDAWMSWNVPYTIRMAELMRNLDLRWIEEPVMPDMIQQYAEIRRESITPIAGGEHEYTRWGMAQLLQAGACDVLQPDPYWAGGISELVKIYAIASVCDTPVIPHGHSMHANVHLMASQPVLAAPMLEYLVKWNQVHQFFLKDKIIPQGGKVTLTAKPGMGMELDLEVAREERYLNFNV